MSPCSGLYRRGATLNPAYTPAWRPGAERRCHGPRRRRPARQTHGVRLGLPVSSHLVSLGTRGGHAGAAVAAGFGGVGRAGESPLPRIGPRGARRFDQGVARPGPEGPRRSGGPGVRRARSGGCVSVRWDALGRRRAACFGGPVGRRRAARSSGDVGLTAHRGRGGRDAGSWRHRRGRRAVLRRRRPHGCEGVALVPVVLSRGRVHFFCGTHVK